MKISSDINDIIANLNFYLLILKILFMFYVSHNICMWLIGLIPITRYYRSLKMSIVEMRKRQLGNPDKEEVSEMIKEKLLQMSGKEFKQIPLPYTFGNIWVQINLALISMIAIAEVASYKRMQEFFNISFLQWAQINPILIFSPLLLLLIPGYIYFVSTDKFEKETRLKLDAQRNIREAKALRDAVKEKMSQISILDGKLDRNTIPDIKETESVEAYQRRWNDRIDELDQKIRVNLFIAAYIIALKDNNGARPTSSSIINAFHYIRACNPYSRYNRKRIFEGMLSAAIQAGDIYTASNIKEINEEHYDSMLEQGFTPNYLTDCLLRISSDIPYIIKMFDDYFDDHRLGIIAMKYY